MTIKKHERMALDFARALASGKYQLAFEMLGRPYKLAWGIKWLEEQYKDMISYGSGAALEVTFQSSMTEWPDKKDDEIGWAYISISGDHFSEAVTVITYWEDGLVKIRGIEWGRP